MDDRGVYTSSASTTIIPDVIEAIQSRSGNSADQCNFLAKLFFASYLPLTENPDFYSDQSNHSRKLTFPAPFVNDAKFPLL